MKINKIKIKSLAKELNINLDIISVDDLVEGIKVELEHGYVSEKTNITNDDLLMTMKITLAHFEESGPLYYKELKKMEEKLSKKWKNSIFI